MMMQATGNSIEWNAKLNCLTHDYVLPLNYAAELILRPMHAFET